MPADRLRPEEIDAAIAATQGRGRRHEPHLDPADLTPIEASYRSRIRRDPNGEDGGGADQGADDPGIPPYPDRPSPDLVYADPDSRLAGGRRRRPWPMLAAGLAIGAFATIVWWAYGTEPPGEAGPAPLITAEEGPAKTRPESEGGLQVPFQDKLIYSQIEPEPDGDPIERLLPPPPAPVEPPEPLVADPEPSAAEAEPPADADATAPMAVAEGTAGEDVAPIPPAVPELPVQTVPLEEGAGADEGANEPAEPAGTTAETAATDVEEAPAPAPVKPEPVEAAPEPESAPAVEEPAPQIARATGGFRVQLAAFRTSDAASTAWTTLQGRHPDLLDPLELNVVKADLGDKGIFFRVQAGPLPDRSAAQSLCDRLQQRNQACLIVKP